MLVKGPPQVPPRMMLILFNLNEANALECRNEAGAEVHGGQD